MFMEPCIGVVGGVRTCLSSPTCFGFLLFLTALWKTSCGQHVSPLAPASKEGPRLGQVGQILLLQLEHTLVLRRSVHFVRQDLWKPTTIPKLNTS
ncbi:hypothetical protein GDO81_003579 [Engystomops pustulosus]|uniref:Secreted protein n=1 Tax=Engystomops pustulosus TaxID=76066 RepID=A0AAV7A6L7_ENGPU|nr:hypothetical protein GDO81_003579 [Engystomops pustulosus]